MFEVILNKNCWIIRSIQCDINGDLSIIPQTYYLDVYNYFRQFQQIRVVLKD